MRSFKLAAVVRRWSISMSQESLALTVAVLVTDGFEQVELTEPRAALDKAGAKTLIVSPTDVVFRYLFLSLS